MAGTRRRGDCKPVFGTLWAVAALLAGGSAAPAQIQWTAGSGGNDHYYQRVEQTGLTYSQARSAAEAMTYLGLPGHLVVFETANYTNELNFVNTSVYSPSVTSSRIYWAGANTPNNASPWTWNDGTTVPNSIVSSWNIDFFEGNGPSGIGFFQPNTGLWDYIETNSSGYVSGYIVEFEPTPIPEPAAVGLLAAAGLAVGLMRRRRAG